MTMKISSLFPISLLAFSMVSAKTDWVPPAEGTSYDWRNTHWFGFNGGTISGPGLSYEYWGQSRGLKVTFLPIVLNETEIVGQTTRERQTRCFSIGAAGLFSFNTPPAVEAGRLGFTSKHYYWFLAASHGEYDGVFDLTRASTASIGLGADLNRRDSRLVFMLGVGPYYFRQSSGELGFKMLPTFEFSWHFGAPRRITP
jgi:hypothetical protein